MSSSNPTPTMICDGLEFPEGPIVMPDGSILLVEIRGGRLTRVALDGTKTTVADWGDPLAAGPNGAAIGPDGAVYVCNNGGFFWHQIDGIWHPQDPATGATQSPVYGGGSIDRVDLETGEITKLYTEADGLELRGPNDIIFDSTGGFWATDLGKARPGEHDMGAVFYGKIDGSGLTRLAGTFFTANGVGLSPDESTLYVSETRYGRLWAIALDSPGVASDVEPRMLERHTGQCVANTEGYFDSLAVQADGNVVVAALGDGLCTVDPTTTDYEYFPIDDPVVTNIAFGGGDLRTAYVTCSGMGTLVSIPWPTSGLALPY